MKMPRCAANRNPARNDRPRRILPMAVLVTAALLAAVACSPTGDTDGGDVSPALSYATCMREHGIDEFPDPVDIDGELLSRLPDDFDLESPAFVAAERACDPERSVADSGNPESQEQVAEELEAMLEFAACMRDQGIDFPDPVVEGDGFSGPAGPLDDDLEGFEAASRICEDKVGATTTR